MDHARTVNLPPLDFRAEIGTVNEEARTVDVIFSTGAAVDRMDYWTGKRYVEKLSLKPGHVRLDRLNAGAAVLDTHSGYSLANVMGAVQPDSARLEKGVGVATLRFARTPDVENVWQKVRDGIVRFVSVGYRVHKFEEDGGNSGQVPVRTAVDWEPYEISMVPMPADAGAKVRAGDVQFNPCLIEGAVMEDRAMPENTTQPEAPAAPAAPPTAAPAVSTDAVRAEAAQAERARIAGIREIAKRGGLDDAFVTSHIDKGSSIDAARSAAFDALATKADSEGPTATGTQVRMGEDARDKWTRGVSNWLLTRSGMAGVIAKHEGVAASTMEPGEFRGLSLIDLAREALVRHGVNVRGLDRMELAGQAMAYRSSYQTISDFAVALETTMNKVLRAAYATQNDTWSRFCGVASVVDFRAQAWYRSGALSVLDDLNEHGEFKNKSVPDAEKTSISASTKGNIIAISRQTIVNDDIGYVVRMMQALGRAGKLTIESAVYTQLLQNSGLGPTQTDSQPFFHSNRANVNASATAITVAGIEADRAVMRSQRDPNLQEYLDLSPTVLLVPVGKRGDALTINDAQFDPADSKFQKPNTVRGLFREVIDTPRLSGTRRYLFADPATAPAIVVSFLEGVQEPVLETMNGWRIDGVEMKARLDVGVNFVDGRTAVTNAGA